MLTGFRDNITLPTYVNRQLVANFSKMGGNGFGLIHCYCSGGIITIGNITLPLDKCPTIIWNSLQIYVFILSIIMPAYRRCCVTTAFFGFLKREGFVDNNVMAKVKMPKVPETIIPTFSEKEVGRLLAQADKGSNEGFRNYCLLLTLIDTGIRLSELANLKTDDIDYEQNLFRVMGKGLRERFIPFGCRVAKAFAR